MKKITFNFQRPFHWVILFLVIGAAMYLINAIVTPQLFDLTNLEINCRPKGKLQFDSPSWKSATPASGKRYEMVDDLLASSKLHGLDENLVTQLLGSPNSAYQASSEKTFVYHLARQRDYPAKSNWFPAGFPNHEAWMLEIVLHHGKVVSVRVFFT